MKDLVGEDIFVVVAMILLEHTLHIMRVIDQIRKRIKETSPYCWVSLNKNPSRSRCISGALPSRGWPCGPGGFLRRGNDVAPGVLVVSSGIFHIPIPGYPFCRGCSAGCLMKQYTTHSVSHSFRWEAFGI